MYRWLIGIFLLFIAVMFVVGTVSFMVHIAMGLFFIAGRALIITGTLVAVYFLFKLLNKVI
jgi:hypothetical protein